MPTEAQHAEICRMKSYFPFRLAYGAFNAATGEFVSGAVPTKRIPNKLKREGWAVWIIN